MVSGLALGFLATAAAIDNGYGLGALRVGPWVAWPQTGGLDIDPYARAALARRGEAPLGRDEGLTFVASVDSQGGALRGRCEYRLSEPIPAARFWTIGLASPSGRPLANPSERYVFTSDEVLRREGGAFELAVARQARAGNWLSPGDADAFVIVLRLYEPPLDMPSRIASSGFPSIVRLGCA